MVLIIMYKIILFHHAKWHRHSMHPDTICDKCKGRKWNITPQSLTLTLKENGVEYDSNISNQNDNIIISKHWLVKKDGIKSTRAQKLTTGT